MRVKEKHFQLVQFTRRKIVLKIKREVYFKNTTEIRLRTRTGTTKLLSETAQ